MKILALLLLFQAAEEHETKHYRLHGEKVDVKDVGRMLEGLHKNLTKHFGRAPKGKLRIEVYGNRKRWQDALRRDGITPPNAGGYYSPKTKTGYLFVQPTKYFTRQLILHEATHQFHYLAATNNNSPGCFWYVEGLAEYFGMHNWDGKELRTASPQQSSARAAAASPPWCS